MDLEPFFRQIEEGAPDFGIRQCKSVTPILDGWSSLVLEVDGEYIFRFSRFQEVKARHEMEAALLPELTKALPVAVPRFEYVWQDELHFERDFVAYRKLPGVPLDRALLRRPEMIQDLARFLSALHAFPTDQAVRLKVPGGSTSSWRQGQRDFYAWVQEQLFPLLDVRQRAHARDTWEPFLDADTNFRFQPVLIHADLAPEHILCDPQAGNLLGVIDWEDAALGDPALDFTGLFSLGEPEAVRAVIGAYQGTPDDGLEDRSAWYLMLVPYHQARYGLLTGNLFHLEQGLQAI